MDKGFSKLVACIIASGCASYAMNWFSLHGVDFSQMGMDSEFVKSTIVGAVTGFLAGITPNSVLATITNAITWFRTARTEIRDAATGSDNGQH